MMKAQDSKEIQDYLHKHIPISKAMEVQVIEAGHERIVLSAPLEPNINHRETVFGGSASSVAILACWTLIYIRLKLEVVESQLVIQRSTMKYERPITGKFEATCTLNNPESWEKFVKILTRKKRSRINISSVLICNGQKVGELEGDFVAIIT